MDRLLSFITVLYQKLAEQASNFNFRNPTMHRSHKRRLTGFAAASRECFERRAWSTRSMSKAAFIHL